MPEWTVPGYTALKGLGSGGFGDVVLARHDASGTLVAIKYLRPDLLADPEFAELFRAEAQVLASMEGLDAYLTCTNMSSDSLTLTCPSDWVDASYVAEQMSRGGGDDGMVSAESTTCTEDPDESVTVAPGGIFTAFVTFHNVPWPGSAVAIEWGHAGTSASVYPFS